MNRVALTLLACAAGAACSGQPRSVSFFAAHLDVAKAVIAECQSGAHRGRECENAEAGVASAARDARMAEFHQAF
jgi:hypothetical protein